MKKKLRKYENLQIPTEITNFLKDKQANSNSPCSVCNSLCCKGPGFALLENLELIFKNYREGKLNDAEHNFENGLDFKDFTYRYFDRVVFNGKLCVFFPKTISKENILQSIPPWNYYEARKYITDRNVSTGCIFLKRRFNREDFTPNHCILHTNDFSINITAKPIDCLFLNCNGLGHILKPSSTQSGYWFELLNYKFPDSESRFNNLISNN